MNHDSSPERPLRLAVFGESIVSDWENPAATSWRALLRALTAAEHDAVFLERRRNRATVELLRARGAGPVRSFAARYPDVRYRTYDLPAGLERSVWFGREVATLDAVVVLDGAPPELHEEMPGYRTRRLLRVLQRTGGTGQPPDRIADGYDLVLDPHGSAGTVPFGPAVEVPVVQPAPVRDGAIVVAYDDEQTAAEIAAALAPLALRLLTPGSLPAPWAFVPEVDLLDVYRAAEVAVVIPADASPLAAARLALPVAAGCPTLTAGRTVPPLPPGLRVPTTTPHTVAADLGRLRASATAAPAVPEDLRADRAAARLVQLLRAERAALRD